MLNATRNGAGKLFVVTNWGPADILGEMDCHSGDFNFCDVVFDFGSPGFQLTFFVFLSAYYCLGS